MTTQEDDDPLPELPSLGDRGDDEPAGADELGLADLPVEGDERVGLDDSAGIEGDEALFSLDVPPKDEVANEDDVDAIPIEGLDGEDEYGWTDANESSDDDWEDDLELGKEATTSEDAGEEGIDEVFEGGSGDDDVSHLPALRGHDPEDDAEDLEGLMAVATFDEESRLVSAAMLPRLVCSIVRLADGPVWCADGDYAGGQGVLAIGSDQRALPDRLVTSVAAFDGAIVVVARGVGGLRSNDGGYAPCDPEGRVLAWVGRDGERVWGVAEGGALFLSEDRGARWNGPLLLAPAVAVAISDEGGVVALSAGRDAPAQIVRSNDGKRWTATSGGPQIGEGARYVCSCGDAIAIACADDPRGPFLSSDRGKTWARVPGLPRTGPIALARERGGLTLYAAHEGFVARHRPGGGEPALVIDRDAVHALALASGEAAILLVASDDGLFRVAIDPEPA